MNELILIIAILGANGEPKPVEITAAELCGLSSLQLKTERWEQGQAVSFHGTTADVEQLGDYLTEFATVIIKLETENLETDVFCTAKASVVIDLDQAKDLTIGQGTKVSSAFFLGWVRKCRFHGAFRMCDHNLVVTTSKMLLEKYATNK